jgi:hypothetical protein
MVLVGRPGTVTSGVAVMVVHVLGAEATARVAYCPARFEGSTVVGAPVYGGAYSITEYTAPLWTKKLSEASNVPSVTNDPVRVALGVRDVIGVLLEGGA